MSSRNRSFTGTEPAGWLTSHRDSFLKTLAEQGYTAGTLRTYGDAASVFCKAVARRGVRAGKLAGRALTTARAAALDAMHANKPIYKRFCLDRFIDALVAAGVAERPEAHRPAPTAFDRLRAEYATYLREQRGLAEKTIYASLSFYDRFMAAQGALLFGTPRPRIQREDGGGSVHLPRGQDYQGDRGHFEEEAERCGGGHFL